MKKINYIELVRDNIVKSDISYRGGNMKVDLTGLFPSLGRPAIVGAYQNYLGGGIAGSIQGAAMFHPNELNARDRKKFVPVLEACKKVFFEINNGGGDEYMQENYASMEFNQRLPESAY